MCRKDIRIDELSSRYLERKEIYHRISLEYAYLLYIRTNSTREKDRNAIQDMKSQQLLRRDLDLLYPFSRPESTSTISLSNVALICRVDLMGATRQGIGG